MEERESQRSYDDGSFEKDSGPAYGHWSTIVDAAPQISPLAGRWVKGVNGLGVDSDLRGTTNVYGRQIRLCQVFARGSIKRLYSFRPFNSD